MGAASARLRPKLVGIQNQNNRIRLFKVVEFAPQNIVRDLFVLGPRIEAVQSGQVDKRNLLAVSKPHSTQPFFDRDAGVVGDLLAQTRQSIEKGWTFRSWEALQRPQYVAV